jgi:hypothetical protein
MSSLLIPLLRDVDAGSLKPRDRILFKKGKKGKSVPLQAQGAQRVPGS